MKREVKRVTLMYTYGKDIYDGGLTVLKYETLGRGDIAKKTTYVYNVRRAGTNDYIWSQEYDDYKSCRVRGMMRLDDEYWTEKNMKRKFGL